MPNESFRSIRLRWDDLRDRGAAGGRPQTPGLDPAPIRGTPRFVGRVKDGGAIPTATGRIYLVSPAKFDGVEGEGASASVVVDASRSIPVAVFGSAAPKAGDLIVAFAVGGRWVAMNGRSDAPVVCDGCTVPRRDLTVSWSNSLVGGGSTVMTFDGTDSWSTGCVNQVRFKLTCRDGAPTFQAIYYTGGPCPTAQPLSCSSPGSTPLGLTPLQQSCSPFLLQYGVTSATCSALAVRGYSRFTVTL